MKKYFIVLLLILALLLTACGGGPEESDNDYDYGEETNSPLDIQYVSGHDDSNIHTAIVVDEETGVNYIVVNSCGGESIAITPRYSGSDWSLYAQDTDYADYTTEIQ